MEFITLHYSLRPASVTSMQHGNMSFPGPCVSENVIFSVGYTGVSQAMRLSLVWPIDFQYHSQALATAVYKSKWRGISRSGKGFEHLQKQEVVF